MASASIILHRVLHSISARLADSNSSEAVASIAGIAAAMAHLALLH